MTTSSEEKPPPPAPCTVLEAVRRKYKYKKPEVTEQEMVDEKILEHTGAKQKLHLLTRVFLPDQNVVSAGEDGELAAACGAIEELDLEGNALQTWASIVTIATQLPSLHWLGLNRLRLDALSAVPDGFASALGGLRTVCLNETGVAWEQLLVLARATPLLEELHFNGNQLASLWPAEEGAELPLQRLRTLFVEDNALTSWEAVRPLASLPALETLNLNGNAIGAIPPIEGFGTLRVLLLRTNPLTEWASIDQLDALPALREARLSDLPLLAPLPAAAGRRLLIGRLGGLRVLNGGEVGARSRDDAERFYVRQCHGELPEGGLPPSLLEGLPRDGARLEAAAVRQMAAALPVPESDAWRNFELRHPRWRVLLVKHGEQRTLGLAGGGGGGTLAAELIELTIRSTAADSAMLPAQSKRLPNGLPLKSLKAIACQLFKLEPTKQQLLYCPPGGEKDIPEPLEDDSKSLADLGIVGGGTVVVEELQE